ncbi:MAG: CPCC family cysteine-rich protein [Cellulosilyticaceae bacterium]
MKILKHRCPCCGYYTFSDKPNGTYDICPVCFWEDDYIQLHDPNFQGGANIVSLNQARQNYISFGACQKEMLCHVRKPYDNEKSGIDF